MRSVELFGSFCLVFFRCIGDATENASKATLFFPEEEGLLLVVVSKMLLWETQFSQIVRASFVVVTTPCLLAFLCQWEFPRGLHIFFVLLCRSKASTLNSLDSWSLSLNERVNAMKDNFLCRNPYSLESILGL